MSRTRDLVDHFLQCQQVDGVCVRHHEEWTRYGCPVAFRAAYRLEPDYRGTDEQEAQMRGLLEQGCVRCWGTGWRDCEVPWCTEQEWHGGYCSCPAGVARAEEEG